MMDRKLTYSRKGLTIAAIATSIGGNGVIAMIRISGPDSARICDNILSANVLETPSNYLKYAKVLNGEEVIDEVMFAYMKGPKTFTGEDIVEIHCHGGTIIPNKVMNLLLKNGAYLAKPGEFTMRGFLNNKMDLAQAEAIQKMISAKSEFAYKMAKNQLIGRLSEKIISFQDSLTEMTAIIEAWVDYPEEGLEFISKEQMLKNLNATLFSMQELANTFYDGQKLSNHLKLCLLGSPNVGKSSLLNTLLRKNRAIVTEIAGTTRDIIEEELQINELLFSISDTAGIRETAEIIEKEGIERSKRQAEDADLVLFLLDSTKEPSTDEIAQMKMINEKKRIVVWNKIDEKTPSNPGRFGSFVCVSAKEELGIERLKEILASKAIAMPSLGSADVFISSQWHHTNLVKACEFVQAAINQLQEDVSAEFISIDLKDALYQLGQIIGRDITEDILDSIFSKFCVGK